MKVITAGDESRSEIQNFLEKDTLLFLSNDIASIHDKKDILEVVHPKLKQLFKTDDIFICILDKSRDTLNPLLRVANERRQSNADYQTLMNSHIPIHDGFLDTILNSDKPVVFDIDEVSKWQKPPIYIATLKATGLKASLSKALYYGKDQIGILTFWSEDKNSFTPNHIKLIQRIGDQISLVVTNMLANESIKRREKEKEILLQISNAITSIRDKNDLIHVIQKILKSCLPFTDIAITKFNLPGGTFKVFLERCEVTNQHPDFESIAFQEYPIADGIHDVIMRSESTVLLSVKQLIKEGMIHIKFLENAGIKELAGIRLQHSNETLGTMVLLSNQENRFSTSDKRILELVSPHFATAMANILYNQEIRRRENEKSIMLSLSNEIAAVRSKEDLFNVIDTKLKELFSVKGFEIALLSEDKKTHSAFLLGVEEEIRSHPDFNEVIAHKYSVTDGVFDVVMNSENPVTFDVNELQKKTETPAYVSFWNKIKIRSILGVRLRVGKTDLGCLLFHVDAKSLGNLRSNLLKGVCSQISIALSYPLANEQIEKQLEEISRYKEQLETEKLYLQEEVSSGYTFRDIIGPSAEMQKVFHLLSQVSFANSTVLLLGETGTGKELIARAIHNSSSRKDKLMFKVNCASIPANLIESELFGHEKGAFTGAFERRIGKFELANKGTLFLDEIGELPIDLQSKLLRALQEKEIERVGGKSVIKIDVRIIAATNRDLLKEVSEGKFRSDLYYRLNVFPITIPPLRSRKEDIPLLVSHFIAKFSKNAGKNISSISNKAIKEMQSYSWPGNVRELEHLIERTVLLEDGNIIKEIHLPVSQKREIERMMDQRYIRTLEENEREHILEALSHCNGKIFGKGGTAELLGINVSTLNSRIKKLGIIKAGTTFKKGSNSA
jgi:formate hydrogenlyase transcriptional activator